MSAESETFVDVPTINRSKDSPIDHYRSQDIKNKKQSKEMKLKRDQKRLKRYMREIGDEDELDY